MTRAGFEQVKRILLGARPLAGEARRRFLDEACAGDAALRAEVDALLAHEVRADALRPSGAGLPPMAELFEALGHPGGAPARDPLPVPEVIGNYRIVRLVAHGGMGAVYEALQEQPQRRVALKMLRADSLSPQMLARFRREAEILGQLQHPGIAQVLEAGTVPVGGLELPFFAMEFVQGRPLTAHAADARLDGQHRVELFARVCDAVEHAHARGVVHRDLKPDNILVTSEGQPKVLDFGVARATDHDVTLMSRETRTGQIIGTLAYMSPEQVAGSVAALDVRSDVYSLGVVLFELLAGRRPHDLSGLTIAAAARVIQEHEAPPLGTSCQDGRGDLGTIVGKALAKEPARRYATAGELAGDLRRYLRHDPVTARPPSRIYQARKFVRRHRGISVGVAIAFAAVVIGLVLALTYGNEAAKERDASLRTQSTMTLLAAEGATEGGKVALARRLLDGLPASAADAWEVDFLRSQLAAKAWDVPLADVGEPPWGSVSPAVVSADGSEVCAFLDARTIGVWSSDLGEELRRFPVAAGASTKVLGLSDDRLAVAYPDRLDVVSASDGEVLASQVLPFAVHGLAWSPSGDRIAVSGPVDGAWELWCGPPGALTRLWAGSVGMETLAWAEGDGGPLCAAARGPDGIGIATWDAKDGSMRSRPVPWQGATSEYVMSAALSPDRRTLVLGDSSRTPWMWRLPEHDGGDGPLPEALRLVGHASMKVQGVAVSSDGRRVASAADSDTVRTWDAVTGACRNVVAVDGFAGMTFLPDGQALIVRDRDHLFRIPFDRGSFPVLPHATYAYDVVFSPDGRLLATRDFEGRVSLWSAIDGTSLGTIPVLPAMKAWAPWGRLQFTEDGRRLLLAHYDEHLTAILDVAADSTWSLSETFPVIPNRSFCAFPNDPTRGVSVLDGTIRATAGGSSTLRLEDEQPTTSSAEWVMAFHHFDGSLSPDARRVVTARRDVTVHDTSNGRLIARLPHQTTVFAVAWSPDGRRIATGDNDGFIRLFDTERFEELFAWQAHVQYVRDLAWSPDGTLLASASGDGTARLWDSRPLADRTRRAAEVQHLEERLRPRVDSLLAAAGGDAAAAADQLLADPSLDADGRHAAIRVLRERSATGDR